MCIRGKGGGARDVSSVIVLRNAAMALPGIAAVVCARHDVLVCARCRFVRRFVSCGRAVVLCSRDSERRV